jgi:hypothetical protein
VVAVPFRRDVDGTAGERGGQVMRAVDFVDGVVGQCCPQDAHRVLW